TRAASARAERLLQETLCLRHPLPGFCKKQESNNAHIVKSNNAHIVKSNNAHIIKSNNAHIIIRNQIGFC
ncbi:MAG: hypothetical protein ACI9P5_002974, partial [Saprospiraceae bacterium]